MATEKIFNDLYLSEEEKKENPPPVVSSRVRLIDGRVEHWVGPMSSVNSAILDKKTGERITIGEVPKMGQAETQEALQSCLNAYNNGKGVWPLSRPATRIEALEKFTAGLKKKRNEIVHIIQWEICKTKPDAEKEVDRTIEYIEQTIKALRDLENSQSTFIIDTGIIAQIRRAPLGIVLVMGPFNYPFNETYTTLIPALIMGNCAIMKLPTLGALCHIPTFELFKECFPPGTINIITGSGKELVGPLMSSGKIDVFAFIGTSKAADTLQRLHSTPHRLRACLGLEAKNPAIILPDADLEVAARECLLGALSYNGQRCTALKILFVHKSIADKFLPLLSSKVDALKLGLPWQKDVKITPLPEANKSEFLKELIADAISKGAAVINANGNKIDRTYVAPTLLFPVTPNMRVWHEEQFGPVVPITTFEKIEEIYDYISSTNYGQQASLFGKDPDNISKLIDILVNQVSRVNLNTQCQRGPDSLPFTGRKDSAYGTLSIYDALRVFSIRSVVATKKEPDNEALINQILSSRSSNFLRMDYIF